jgi:hypothetical protein
MTAIFMDGFDHYGSGGTGAANMLRGVWAQVGGAGPVTPSFGARTGTYALGVQSTQTGGDNRLVLPATEDELFISCGFASATLPASDTKHEIIRFITPSNVDIAELHLHSNGRITLQRSGIEIAATQGPVIVAGNWHFLEMRFKRATSTGIFTLRVDDATGVGTPAINATGLSLGATGVGQIAVNTHTGTTTGIAATYIDDLFIRNASGTTNNGWLGDRRIAMLSPNADTTTSGWEPRYYKNIGEGILTNTTASSGVSAATATALNIGANEFTLEGFVRFQSLPSSGQADIFSRWDEVNNRRSYEFYLSSTGNLSFRYSTDGTAATVTEPISYPWVPELNTWYHMAIVRAAGEDLLFVDGEQLGLPIADSATYFAGTAPFGIGVRMQGTSTVVASTSLDGWFDECRFTNGYARYTANFTPPTTEFPRNSTDDPEWASVVLLADFDSVIQDASSFARTLTARGSAAQFEPTDGPDVGVYSTVNKVNPDDNTFMEAAYLPATSILTLSAQPSNNDTVTVGTTDGVTPAVYTFVTSLVDPFDVLIDTTLQQTLQNLYNAINAGAGSGTKYGTGTTANVDVIASQLPAGQMLVTATVLGTAGNSVATSDALTATGGWTGATLDGGEDIPGPTDFKIVRPPPYTTIVSAVQIVFRGLKTDAGLASVNSALVGALGGVSSASPHNLSVTADYYNDIYEVDPDTAGPISPSTLINGRIQINRAT